jgi:hypothetical protein
MKLRIQGNSLRLRLTQPEVDAFRADGRIEERIRFAPGVRLVYAIEASPSAQHLSVHYDRNEITVTVPEATMHAWADTDQVGMEGDHTIEGDKMLSLLIEKDFQCLHHGEDAKDPNAFPHPLDKE